MSNAADLVGVLMLGGSGTRLSPVTRAVNKHLLPVFDKPMVYYSLSTLLLCGARRVIAIVNPRDRSNFEHLLGDGQRFGIQLTFVEQTRPGGIVHGLMAAANEIEGHHIVVALGDNVLHGPGLGRRLQEYSGTPKAHVFAYPVNDIREYGVVNLSEDKGRVTSFQEKPERSGPGLAVIGLYFYPPRWLETARTISPSRRGEIEISELNSRLLAMDAVDVEVLPRGTFWMDVGSSSSLAAASNYVQVLETRTGQRIGCLEEIAWRQGWLSTRQLIDAAESERSDYADYLHSLVHNDRNAT